MKRKLLLAAIISAALVGCNEQATEQVSEEAQTSSALVLETDEARVSYGMGIGLGKRIKQEPFAIDVEAFAAGLKHAVTDAEQLMTDEQINEQIQAFQQKQMEQAQAEFEAKAAEKKAEGEAFLAANASKDGVITTDSGLQYKVLTAGDGAKPAETDTVEVHYRGTLLDGTEFDSSYARKETVSFPVNGVIPGWVEALQMMPVGSKWQLYIPSDLAYGPGGTGGGPIGPNETLIFEVELIAIEAAEQASES